MSELLPRALMGSASLRDVVDMLSMYSYTVLYGVKTAVAFDA